MAPIATTSPITWTSPAAQRRAHALTVRATFAKKAPAKPVACNRCMTIHPGEC